MIDLPSAIGPVSATPRLLDFGGFLEPGLGGKVQRINRMGTRFALAVTMPPMRSDMDGRIFVSRLIRGKSEGVRMEYPMLDFKPGSPGSFGVDGAGQAGRTLQIRGGTPRYAFKEGQPFSIVDDGQHFLHFIDAQAIADGSGDCEIMFSPMLRVPFSDGAPLHVGKPMIEGYIMGDELAWDLALNRTIGIAFEIWERQ